MATKPAEAPMLAAAQSWWLLALAAVALAPLATHLPAWLTGKTLAALTWRGWLAWRQRPLPSRWLLTLLVLAGSAGVGYQFGGLFGQNPGVALLVLFLALKQLETRTVRDGRAIVLLAYFLALAQFFYSQTIPAALATAAVVVVATATLLCLADARPTPAGQLRRAGIMLGQALPFMLLLFVLFPRVQGPLWGLPKDAGSGLTGLSDSMAPGAISHLSQSDAIAFRVRFDAVPPARHQWYWRGPVLSEFDGRTWRPRRELPRATLPYAEPEDGGIGYEITLEAHGKPWLFALELPGATPEPAFATLDYQLLAKSPVLSRQRYAVRSYPSLRAGANESPVLLQQSLALPPGSNPRIRRLAAGWRAGAQGDEDVLGLAQAFFLRQGLLYTLNPPLLGEHGADEFLFDTKQGFCEHFASAFAVAMRAAGVPARVVTGYQGGEINPVDGYLTVRQYDAHAWTEVWLAGRGWLRIDPTAISAPTRIDLDLAAAVPAGDPLPLLMRADLAWLRDLRFRWDAVTNSWNQWVLGYNPERQRQLLQRLGLPSPDWRAMTAMLAALCGLALLILTAWTLRRPGHVDPLARQWRKLSRRLARRGLGRRPEEGPLDYARRVGEAQPAIAADMHARAALYARLRYAAPAADRANALDQLRHHVASFRP